MLVVGKTSEYQKNYHLHFILTMLAFFLIKGNGNIPCVTINKEFLVSFILYSA